MEKDYEIVSLGENCIVRTVLTRHKIKPSKAEGELSCPFDLVSHPMAVILKTLKENFKTYFDDFYFSAYRRHIFDFRNMGYWMKSDGTCFFHDKDCKANDLDKLVTRIKRRVENFNNILDAEKPILFIINIRTPESRSYINDLYDFLKVRRAGKKFVLAVLDFNGIVYEKFYPEIKVLNMDLPMDLYHKNWNKRNYRNKPIGKYTERCICSFVNNILENDFKTVDK